MIKHNDIVTFKVWYMLNGEIQKFNFQSFAAAAGHAEGMKGKAESSIYIDFTASNYDGSSQVSAGLYKYDKKTNTREVIHQHYINEIMHLGKAG